MDSFCMVGLVVETGGGRVVGMKGKGGLWL
jgi:hypothetical protein